MAPAQLTDEGQPPRRAMHVGCRAPAPPPLLLDSLHNNEVQGLQWHDMSLNRDRMAMCARVLGGALRRHLPPLRMLVCQGLVVDAARGRVYPTVYESVVRIVSCVLRSAECARLWLYLPSP